jgi:hypothetical protein
VAGSGRAAWIVVQVIQGLPALLGVMYCCLFACYAQTSLCMVSRFLFVHAGAGGGRAGAGAAAKEHTATVCLTSPNSCSYTVTPTLNNNYVTSLKRQHDLNSMYDTVTASHHSVADIYAAAMSNNTAPPSTLAYMEQGPAQLQCWQQSSSLLQAT